MAGVAVKRGDIVLVKVPFLDDPAKGKVRPVVVVQNDVGNKFGRSTIIVPVTSSIPSKLYPVQLLLQLARDGLRVKSVVDAGYFFKSACEVYKHIFSGSRKDIRERTATTALAYTLDLLRK